MKHRLPHLTAFSLVAVLVPLSPGLARASAAETNTPIPWSELGAKATAQYSGDGLNVSLAPNGAVRLRCAFQKLAGEVTPDGLWLTSTVEGAPPTRFRVVADYVGRDGGAMVALPERGVAACEPGKARYLRRGLVEEYSVSADGVRQDFVVAEPPGGRGPLRVELAVTGAQAEAAAGSARLVLDGSGRKLAYSRLRVTDAADRELTARMVVEPNCRAIGSETDIAASRQSTAVSEGKDGGALPSRRYAARLAVVVEDAGAAYPVRIDPTFSDANWISMGGLNGADDFVYAAVVDGSGDLYIGGSFTVVGDVFANRIAKWNGNSWSALGSGMNDSVRALAVSGGTVYAGGAFTTAGGSVALRIAKWNGSSWSALGSGMNNTVFALAVSGDDLYAGGVFTTAGGSTANRIAKWSASSWSALGSGMNSQVSALAVSGSDLYAGGQFTTAGGSAANYIAKWSAGSWSALGSGMNSYVLALAVSDGDLYAGGNFTTAGGSAANRIAKWNWNEGSWSALGSGMNNLVYALAVSGDDLYAGGYFMSAGGTWANRIAKWNEGSWSALGPGMNSYVYALAGSDVDRYLYVGGAFTTAGASGGNRIAKWSAGSWSALGAGMDGHVNALAVSVSGNLYAGGNFTTAGGSGANNIAVWSGHSWFALGEGLTNGVNGTVNALAVSGDGVYWYAGGLFTKAGGSPANYIAKWNGSRWLALGSGMNGYVYALAVLGSDLYAGGLFTTAGGNAANYIAKWDEDEDSWSAVGSGMNGNVYALAVSGNVLYAGGQFTTAGGIPANRIAKWDESSWSALGSGMNDSVRALAVSGSDLYAGGQFTTAGGSPANRIAKWNESSWSALGSGMNNFVLALAVLGSDLYAGGNFTSAGGKLSTYAAKALMYGLVACDATYVRAEGLLLRIPISEVAWDVNSNPVSVTAAGPSVQGVTITWNSTYFFYTPANNNDDSFSYTVSSGAGTATGTITVNVVPSGGTARAIEVSGGSVTVRFFGIPDIQYDVERTTSMTEPVTWTTLNESPLSPGADGSFSFTDTSPPPGTAYYRSVRH